MAHNISALNNSLASDTMDHLNFDAYASLHSYESLNTAGKVDFSPRYTTYEQIAY